MKNEIQPRKHLEQPSIEAAPTDLETISPATAHDHSAEAWRETPRPTVPRNADRRVALRHRATDGRCWIGWHDRGVFRSSAAWIIDISSSGALIAADKPPPTDLSIWLRLDNPAFPEWAETRLVNLLESQSGIYAARIVFRGVCPYALIKAVAFSTTGQCPSGTGPGPSWHHNTW